MRLECSGAAAAARCAFPAEGLEPVGQLDAHLAHAPAQRRDTAEGIRRRRRTGQRETTAGDDLVAARRQQEGAGLDDAAAGGGLVEDLGELVQLDPQAAGAARAGLAAGADRPLQRQLDQLVSRADVLLGTEHTH